MFMCVCVCLCVSVCVCMCVCVRMSLCGSIRRTFPVGLYVVKKLRGLHSKKLAEFFAQLSDGSLTVAGATWHQALAFLFTAPG